MAETTPTSAAAIRAAWLAITGNQSTGSCVLVYKEGGEESGPIIEEVMAGIGDEGDNFVSMAEIILAEDLKKNSEVKEFCSKISDLRLNDTGVVLLCGPGAEGAPINKVHRQLVLHFHEEDGMIRALVRSRLDPFTEPEVAMIARLLERAVNKMCAADTTKQASTTSEDLRQIWTWNAAVPETVQACVHDLFTERARQQPDAPAICAWDGELTYGELDAISTKLAHSLAKLGAGPGTIVPLCFEKSMWTSVAMLAVMKAGAASVAMDTTQPVARLRTIVEQALSNSQQRLIISSVANKDLATELVNHIGGDVPVVVPAEVAGQNEESVGDITPLAEVSPQDLLYVVFTSGSTGVPKGAMITHANFSTAVQSQQEALGFNKESRVFDYVSYAFDVAWSNVLHSLTVGGCLCVPNDADRLSSIADSINTLGANFAHITPTVAQFISAETVPNLRTIAFIGEKLSRSVAAAWQDVDAALNTYGPAECTVTATVFPMRPGSTEDPAIGNGCGAAVWIVQPDGNGLVSIGEIGELWIEGPLVGKGYLGDPEKTALAFIDNPAWLVRGGPGCPGRHGRLYRTGDLVRYDTDGVLHFIGRKDDQVKIRGQRVELGDIEHHLKECLVDYPDVGVVVEIVQPAQSETKIVVAMLALETAAHDDKILSQILDSIDAQLGDRLPAYMIPGAYIPLANFPMTATGKTDRRRLREMGAAMTLQQLAALNPASSGNHNRTAPSTKMELQLQQLWAEVLGISPESIAAEDSFLRIGGDSVAAMRLVALAPGEIPLDEVETTSKQDLEQIWAWNAAVPETVQACVHDLFTERARQQPDAPAICAWDGELTYGELDAISTKLAHSLAKLGAGPGTIVPLCFEKSMWTSVAMLAVMKAGAASVAMDTTQPVARLRTIVEQALSNSQQRLIISSVANKDLATELVNHIGGDVPVVVPAEVAGQNEESVGDITPLAEVSPQDLLYVVFTSGSTGVPKGAMITHANFTSGLTYQQSLLGFTATSRVFDYASYAFDVAWSNFLHTLTAGGCLCVPNNNDRYDSIARAINSLRATLVHLTPTVAQLISPLDLPIVQTLILGGEKLTMTTASQWENVNSVLNTYGPAECTITATVFHMGSGGNEDPAIGKGSGAVTWVVHPNGNGLVSIGEIGELWIEGPLVGKGYLGDPEKTALGFIDNPAWLVRGGPGCSGRHGRLYRTGDLVRKQDLEQIWAWNAAVPETVQACVHDLFTERARQQPDAPAICAWDGELTYGELDAISTKLAHSLAKLGAGPGTIVPLCFEKSMWTSVAMLAVMKAGAASVAMDTTQPVARLRTIVEQALSNSQQRLIISSVANKDLATELVNHIGGDVPVVVPAEVAGQNEESVGDIAPLAEVSPQDLLYVVFTSGSTGVPKGAMITHANFSTAGRDQQKSLGYTARCRVFDHVSYAFDLAWSNVLHTLTAGGCLCVPSEGDRFNSIADSIHELRVTFMLLTPTVSRLVRQETVPHVETIVFAGEKLSRSVASEWDNIQFALNAYGPAECTVFTTISQVGRENINYPAIGKGFGTVTWVVHPNCNGLVSIGEIGELWIEGPLVGKGYLGDPEKTALAFIDNPAWLVRGGPGCPGRHGRLYRTGDLVRYDTDGVLHFIGRKDDQVKIRGQRVELGDIEHHLKECLVDYPDVGVVVEIVQPAQSETKIVVAMLALETAAHDDKILSQILDSIDAQLGDRLPAYMIPGAYIPLANFPMTATGKTDRRRLREMGAAMTLQQLAALNPASSGNHNRTAPSTKMELQLQQLWAEVLGISPESIAAEDSFLRIGGDSVAAMRLVALARKQGLLLTFELVLHQLYQPKISNIPLDQINTTSKQDLEQIWAWNAAVPETVQACVHDLFTERARQQPDAPAICAWDGELTYGELDAISTKLAHSLAKLGAGPGTIVPLCFEKSMWTSVAMLAVMKAGAASVAMDTTQPVARLRTIVEQALSNSQQRLIISSVANKDLATELVNHIGGDVPVVVPAEVAGQNEESVGDITPLAEVSPQDLLYVVFTSGSTGVPKGVMITHANFTSALRHQQAILCLNDQTRLLDFAPYAFDASWYNNLSPITSGGTSCVPSQDDRMTNLSAAISRLRANYISVPPSAARVFSDEDFKHIKTIVLGGEMLLASDANFLRKAVNVVNVYGPAECTVISTVQVVNGENPGNPGIGRGFGTVTWVVQLDGKNLMSIGEIGELWIEGPQVGQGYLGDAEKTAAAFVNNPAWLARGGPGCPGRHGRLYRTGDLVRYDADGVLHFIGRKDDQVKIRGQRVELGDIEHHLKECLVDYPNVGVVVEIVQPAQSKTKIVVALLALETAANDDKILSQILDSIDAQLGDRLPAHMIPDAYIPLANFPMTATGKTDRRRLREMGAAMTLQQLAALNPASSENRTRTAPSTKMELQLQQLWAVVLKISPESIAAEDNFLRIGGDSVAAMRLVGRARDQAT
ncbi:hypothetical protein PspLS_11920 [Pyricularia sp. CBS 133598]|nr:hypothetical protein PspLS_11920 [Pyricularia sp. CBS 133598]